MAEKQLSKDDVWAHRKQVCTNCGKKTYKAGMLFCNTSKDKCCSMDSCPEKAWKH